MTILNFNEFISQNEPLNEGFLNNLKTAIKRVIKDPKQYIDDNMENIHNKFENKMDKGLAFEMNKFYKKNKDEIIKELENLCNDDDLKTIYNYMKSNSDKFIKDKDSRTPYDSKYSMSYIEKICYGMTCKEERDKVKKIIRDNMFEDASDAKCFAVLEIMYAFYYEYFERKEKEKINKYVDSLHHKKSSSSYHSSNSSDDTTTFYAGVGAALSSM